MQVSGINNQYYQQAAVKAANPPQQGPIQPKVSAAVEKYNNITRAIKPSGTKEPMKHCNILV